MGRFLLSLPMNVSYSSTSASDGFLFLVGLWLLVWLVVLATALSRKDFDPITRLTWVLVIILVPVFGVLLYWVVGPSRPPVSSDQIQNERTDKPSTCVTCGTTISAGSTVCPKCGWTYK